MLLRNDVMCAICICEAYIITKLHHLQSKHHVPAGTHHSSPFRRTNNKREAYASLLLLVRRKGLEPPTY